MGQPASGSCGDHSGAYHISLLEKLDNVVSELKAAIPKLNRGLQQFEDTRDRVMMEQMEDRQHFS